MKQTLPYDATIEKGLFCIILFNPDEFVKIADLLIASDFYEPSHQQIWQAMIEIFKEGKDIDFPVLRIQLKKQDISPQPALTALSEAMEENSQPYHLMDFVKEIKNKSLLRQIIRTAKSHGYSAQLEDANATELLGTMEKDLLSLAEKISGTRPIDPKGIIQEIDADIKAGLQEGWSIYQTGFDKLDEHTGGLIPSQVWIVGAYTGVGKTFLLLQMILHVLRQGGKVVLFSTEMDRKLNILRLLGNIAQLGTIQIMRNRLNDDELARLQKAKEELEKYEHSLMIYDTVYSLEELRLKTKKLKIEYGINVVIVDYLQNLAGEGSIYERMSEAATTLYRMAQELKVTLVLGSQVSQTSAGWQAKEAIEFKGAGEIAAIADVAVWLTKDGKGNKRVAHLRKVRHGATGKNMAIELEFPSGRIIQLEKSDTKTEEEQDVADISQVKT